MIPPLSARGNVPCHRFAVGFALLLTALLGARSPAAAQVWPDTAMVRPDSAPAPVALGAPTAPSRTLRRATRAGIVLGAAAGLQAGAVWALSTCRNRREEHCLYRRMAPAFGVTVAGGAIGAAVGRLWGRVRARGATPARPAE